MKIVHIELAGSFTEGMTYQGNQLSYQNIIDGHSVLFISNAHKYENGKLVSTDYEDYILDYGMRLIRMPYVRIFGNKLTQKIRCVNGLYEILEEFKPDIIFSHSLSYLSVIDVLKYVKKHPYVIFYADTHTSEYNSASTWFSKTILHKCFYRGLTKATVPYLKKYFYVGESERVFAKKYYNVPDDIMEFFPLGGTPLNGNEYLKIRKKRREELELQPNEVLLMHSGKFSVEKRTIELINAFTKIKDTNSKLILVGYIPKENEETINEMICNDNRIIYLGWKKGEELKEYLCACDLYCQPGSVSATLQNAICCNCAIMAYPHLPYVVNLNYENFIWVRLQKDMEDAFESIKNNPSQLIRLKNNSTRCAEELLDYKKIAKKLYQ